MNQRRIIIKYFNKTYLHFVIYFRRKTELIDFQGIKSWKKNPWNLQINRYISKKALLASPYSLVFPRQKKEEREAKKTFTKNLKKKAYKNN